MPFDGIEIVNDTFESNLVVIIMGSALEVSELRPSIISLVAL